MGYYSVRDCDKLMMRFGDFKEDYLYNFSLCLNRPLIGPRTLQLNLTSRCNLQCRMCGTWKEKMLECEAVYVKKLIGEAYRMGNLREVIFTGGEALLRADLRELIAYVKQTCPRAYTILNTNGVLLTEPVCRSLIDVGLDVLSISIDSPVAAVHDSLRGEGVFEKVTKAIDFLNAEKARTGQRNPQLVTCSVLMEPTLDTMYGMLEFCGTRGFVNMLIQAYVPHSNFVLGKREDSFWIRPERLPALKRVLERIDEHKNDYPGLHVEVPVEKLLKYYTEPVYVDKCYVGFKQVLLVNKTISFVCCGDCGEERTYLGFVDRHTLQEAWSSERAQRFRGCIKACKRNCVQFCSIRPSSDSADGIHDQISAQDNLFFSLRELQFLEDWQGKYPELPLKGIIARAREELLRRGGELCDYAEREGAGLDGDALRWLRNDIRLLEWCLLEKTSPEHRALRERCSRFLEKRWEGRA